MTLHPLSKELLSATLVIGRDRDEAIDKMVRRYLTGRAEWLKNEPCAEGYNDTIDQAFQLTPETLEEKFNAIRHEHDGKGLYSFDPEGFWAAVLKEFAKAAEEHFHNQPLARTVNCSVRQTPQAKGTY